MMTRSNTKAVAVTVLSMIISFSSNLSSSVSAYSFGDEVCNGAHTSGSLQDATWNAMNNVLSVARDNIPKNYLSFCADGTEDIYTMHSYATCASSDGCYDCLVGARNYLLNVCGDKLGANVHEKETSHCYIRFENYIIYECAKTS